MTTDSQQQKGEDLINVNNTVILTNLPEGQHVKLRDGSIAGGRRQPTGWRMGARQVPGSPRLPLHRRH